MNDRRWDVFISYGHADSEWVRVLASNLHREGFDVFLDIWEVVGGDRFTGRLEEGIRQSGSGILVCSPEALARPWVIEEYEALLRRAVHDPSRRLIPVLLADAELPPFLGNRAWVDFRGVTTGPLYDAALDELVRNLRDEPGAERPSRASAREWPASVAGKIRPAGPMALSLRLSRAEVTLVGGGDEVTHRPRGLQASTREAVLDLARIRSRREPGSAVAYRGPAGPTLDSVLADVGRHLSADFLGGAVGQALATRVAEAESLGERVELGLEVNTDLSNLPWETLMLPSPDGTVPDIGGTPLVLHHNLAVYRAVSGLGPTPAYKVRGPLRILVAIGSPESQDRAGELLNYEAELTRIVRSVEDARRGGSAYVRVLHRGTLGAIRRALTEDTEGFHVLHLSCHAGPGVLVLEDDDGMEDRVTARRLVDEGVPAGTDLPLVVLAGCATGLQSPADTDGEAALVSMAEDLTRRGVPQVLAMQAPVSDSYATELAGELYGWLATAHDTDTLVALAEARRACERRRQDLPASSPRRGSPEWATPALLVRGPRLPLYNRSESFGPIPVVSEPALAEGVVVRGVGEFVGRRREEREGRRALATTKAGLVIHGIGGVGKSTLAAELVRSVGPGIVVASKAGAIGIDTLLDEVGLRLGDVARAAGAPGEAIATAAQTLRQSDIEWGRRWDLMSQVLAAVPILVLLDNFEDNLSFVEGTWELSDPEFAALLVRWARHAGQSKLLFTSRHPFTLPDDAQRRLATLHLGPLSPAETAKLIWQLPGLDALSSEELARAYQDVGGHPRTLEYLDALLRGGDARFEDVAERMERQLAKRGIEDPQAWLGSETRGVDAALAEAVTLAVDDVVLGDLLGRLAQTPLARELVVGASVYRQPVDATALVWQVGTEVELLPDPARQERIQRVNAAYQAAVQPGESEPPIESLGLSPAEVAQYQADIDAAYRPPLRVPFGIETALAAAASAGLLSPMSSGELSLWFVHRWTARAIADLDHAIVRAAHAKAAHFWRWRVARISQSPEQDIEQLIEARFHHHASGDTAEAVGLTGPIVGQLRTWGHYGRAAELCRQTLGWVAENSHEAGEMHSHLGSLAHPRGELALAEAHHSQAIRILEQLGDEGGAASNYGGLAILAEDRGDYDAAEAGYLRAVSIHERVGDERNAAAGYTNLGNLANRRGDYDDAEARHRQSLEISERLGDQAAIAASYTNLGNLAKRRGDYDAAETRHRQSLEISERLGDQAGMAASSGNLGILARLRGDYDAAEARYRQSLGIYERLGDQSLMAKMFINLGILARLRGDYDAAETRHRQSLEIWERLGDPSGMAVSYSNLGNLDQLRGDYDAAEARYRQSLEISERLGDPSGTATTCSNLGNLALLRGDDDDAEALFRRSLEIQERLGDQSGIAMSYSNLGNLHINRGEDESAVALNVTAVALRLRLGVPDVVRNMATLSDLRTRMGAERFTSALDTSLEAESKAHLLALLDDLDSRQADDDAPE